MSTTYECSGVQYTSTSQKMRGRNWISKQRSAFSWGTVPRKGYHLYDQKTSSIIHSRDVVFNESSKGYGCEEEKQLIQVENFTEEEPEATEPEEDSGQVESGDDSSEPERDDDLREPDREDSMDLPVPRRTSTRVIQRPDYYGVRVYTAAELQKEPQTVNEALNCSEKEQWEAAMQKEMGSIYSNNVWDLVELPENRKLIEASGYSRRKPRHADGSIERYKARLVAQGFS